jgi:hypothetical protein
MRNSTLLRHVIALAAVLAAGDALAQSACQRYRAELAALDRGGGRPSSGAAERQRVEIARLSGYYRSIGCGDRGPLGGFFGGPPPECASIAQRLRQMEATYAGLAAQADDFGNVEARRRQLQAAIGSACAAEQQDAFSGPRSFFETLFGPPRGSTPRGNALEPERLPMDPEGEVVEKPLGGRRLVCVRSCDGYYFPLGNGGRETADEMCQALCPGTETTAFAMPGSDDALDRAISLRGRPYTSMQNAFRFQKSFDESCACKREGESWSVVLRRAESMLEQKRGDIIVTAEKSEELSRPKQTPAQAREKDRKAAEKTAAEKAAADKKASDAAETQESAETGNAAPTASKESAGIGPQSIENSQVVRQNEGPKQDVTVGDGSKRQIRVIAPDIIPVPKRSP